MSDRKTAKKMKGYMLSKLPRIGRYLHNHGEEAVVKAVLSSEKLRHTAEIIVNGTKLRATASVTCEDMSSSIDKVMDAVIKQLRRKGDKKISARRRKTDGGPPPEKPETPEVKIQRVAAKPMSLEEGVLQLNASEKEFLAFINSKSQEMNVIYKRDRKIFLIVP